jgi:sulfoxide reductase heme-binding subunit YedZ
MTIALASPKFVWFLMRGSGFVALVLLTLTVVLGVVGVNRWKSGRWPRVITAGLHRNLSLLALCFLAIHVITAMIDSWVGLGWLGVVLPFQTGYRPLWVGMGVLASDLLIAVIVTSLLRRHIKYGTWRFVHWVAWLMWPLALIHGIGAGTDASSGWGLSISLACLALVAGAALWRFGPAAGRALSPEQPTAAPSRLLSSSRRSS